MKPLKPALHHQRDHAHLGAGGSAEARRGTPLGRAEEAADLRAQAAFLQRKGRHEDAAELEARAAALEAALQQAR